MVSQPLLECAVNLSWHPLIQPQPRHQDTLRPYPWPRSRHSACKPEHVGDSGPHDQDMTASGMLDCSTASGMTDSDLSATSSASGASDGIGDDADFLEYKVPPVGAPAGKALQHAKRVMLTLFQKHEPLIFKIGYTHCPRWRWCNSIYGYKKDRVHKWSKMVILYESAEPFGPAMLEATLIDLFGCTSVETLSCLKSTFTF